MNEILYKFASSHLCDSCGILEDVKHLLKECKQHEDERQLLPLLLDTGTSAIELLGTLDTKIYRVILTFLEWIGRDF